MKQKNKILIFVLTLFVLFFVFFTFYKINENNYEKHNEIKESLIDHPENLPKKEVAKASSF
jgi:nucleoside recognition membrane protein YjiH